MAFDQYELGRGKGTDFFAVSFSSHDYVGHQYGPNSREMEEMTVSDDAAIAQLLSHIKRSLPNGLDDVAIAFTADHGMPASPDDATEHRLPGGRLDEKALVADIEAALTRKFGKGAKGERWVPFTEAMAYYLNHAWIASKKLDPARVQAVAKAAIEKRIGVAYAFTQAEYRSTDLPPGMHERQILHTFTSGRMPDVVLIPRPYYITGSDPDTHETGIFNDRTVPIILAGAWFKPGVYAGRADVIDIAPTCCSWPRRWHRTRRRDACFQRLSAGPVPSERRAGLGAVIDPPACTRSCRLADAGGASLDPICACPDP